MEEYFKNLSKKKIDYSVEEIYGMLTCLSKFTLNKIIAKNCDLVKTLTFITYNFIPTEETKNILYDLSFVTNKTIALVYAPAHAMLLFVTENEFTLLNPYPELISIIGSEIKKEYIDIPCVNIPQKITMDDFCYFWSLLIGRCCCIYDIGPITLTKFLTENYKRDELKNIMSNFMEEIMLIIHEFGIWDIFKTIELLKKRLPLYIIEKLDDNISDILLTGNYEIARKEIENFKKDYSEFFIENILAGKKISFYSMLFLMTINTQTTRDTRDDFKSMISMISENSNLQKLVFLYKRTKIYNARLLFAILDKFLATYEDEDEDIMFLKKLMKR